MSGIVKKSCGRPKKSYPSGLVGHQDAGGSSKKMTDLKRKFENSTVDDGGLEGSNRRSDRMALRPNKRVRILNKDGGFVSKFTDDEDDGIDNVEDPGGIGTTDDQLC
jgi:hypothetical protein